SALRTTASPRPRNTDGIRHELPAAIALVNIFDGEAARRLTAVTIVADQTYLGVLAIGGADDVDIGLRMQHVGEKIVVIPGLDGEVLSGDGLRIDGGDSVRDVTLRRRLQHLIEHHFSKIQNSSTPLRVCGAPVCQNLMPLEGEVPFDSERMRDLHDRAAR